jgi:hypothetical protein
MLNLNIPEEILNSLNGQIKVHVNSISFICKDTIPSGVSKQMKYIPFCSVVRYIRGGIVTLCTHMHHKQ